MEPVISGGRLIRACTPLRTVRLDRSGVTRLRRLLGTGDDDAYHLGATRSWRSRAAAEPWARRPAAFDKPMAAVTPPHRRYTLGIERADGVHPRTASIGPDCSGFRRTTPGEPTSTTGLADMSDMSAERRRACGRGLRREGVRTRRGESLPKAYSTAVTIVSAVAWPRKLTALVPSDNERRCTCGITEQSSARRRLAT